MTQKVSATTKSGDAAISAAPTPLGWNQQLVYFPSPEVILIKGVDYVRIALESALGFESPCVTMLHECSGAASDVARAATLALLHLWSVALKQEQGCEQAVKGMQRGL